MNPALVAERCQLLRTWTTDELVEMEDARSFLECLVATELCPPDGEVFWRRGGDVWSKHFYDPSAGRHNSASSIHSMFHDSRNDTVMPHAKHLPATQLREQAMGGWGDDIEQYHALNSMMKLNPRQIMMLYENAVTKQDVERFVEDAAGGLWFWNNGETLLHAWLLTLHGRGLSVDDVKEKIDAGRAGIVVDSS